MNAEMTLSWDGVSYRLIPEDTNGHHPIFMPDFVFARHVHPAYHLILVERACCTLEVTGCPPLLCRENTLIMINPNVEHRFVYTAPEGCMHSGLVWNFVAADGRYLLRPLQELGGLKGKDVLRPYVAAVLTPVQASRFRLLQRESERFLRRHDPGVSSLKFFNLLILAMEFLWGAHWRRDAEAGRTTAATALVDRIRLLIELNFYYRHFDLGYLAEELGRSANYLNTIFSRETGRGIAAALRMRRLEHARELLETTHHPVKYIYEQCGFTRQNYFAAAFRRESGMTPLEYRKLFGGGGEKCR